MGGVGSSREGTSGGRGDRELDMYYNQRKFNQLTDKDVATGAVSNGRERGIAGGKFCLPQQSHRRLLAIRGGC